MTAFPTIESSFDAAAVGAAGYVDGPLFGDEIVEVVSQAITGPFPVLHPDEIRGRNQVPDPKQAAEPASAIDPRVREAMATIDADLAKAWSVHELACRVDLSDSRFRHLFGAEVGVSVTQFRLERRLGVGARMLGTTYEDVRQIAQALGFTAQGFRRALLARYGVTPTEYRSRFWRGWRSPNQHEQ